jgi:hypothetical protein
VVAGIGPEHHAIQRHGVERGRREPDLLGPVVPIRGKQAIELRLTVTDSAGATASDTMTVTVASNDYVVFATGTPAPPLGLYSYDAETGDVATLFAPLTDRGFLDEAIAPDRSRVAYLSNELAVNQYDTTRSFRTAAAK